MESLISSVELGGAFKHFYMFRILNCSYVGKIPILTNIFQWGRNPPAEWFFIYRRQKRVFDPGKNRTAGQIWSMGIEEIRAFGDIIWCHPKVA